MSLQGVMCDIYILHFSELEVCGMFRSMICYNNGTCDEDNNTCTCSYPYTGYDCSETICKLFFTAMQYIRTWIRTYNTHTVVLRWSCEVKYELRNSGKKIRNSYFRSVFLFVRDCLLEAGVGWLC